MLSLLGRKWIKVIFLDGKSHFIILFVLLPPIYKNRKIFKEKDYG